MIRTDQKHAVPARNLGALSWVLGDLSQSLPLATLSLQRAARDAMSAGPFGTESPDDSNLRSASQQIRQAAGALAIIGYTEVAKVLGAAESACDYFLRMPRSCTEDSVSKVNRACIAVINFLQANMGGYNGSPVALYPCYSDVQKIYSAQHCHPADLWSHTWHAHMLAPWTGEEPGARGLQADNPTAAFDRALLGCIRGDDRASAEVAANLCGNLAHANLDQRNARYWYAAAAFFEAIGLRLLTLTPQVKRSMADIRNQFLVRNATTQQSLEHQTRGLVFFCACATVPEAEATNWLRGVRRIYGLESEPSLDYTSDFFSRRDPQHLALARRRHEALAESWNALVGGHHSQLSQVRPQFSALCELLTALEPKSAELLQVMGAYLDELQHAGAVPSAAMAMEMTLALLALEAVCDILLPAPKMVEHQFNELIKRLGSARKTHRHPPLEDWMAHILRRSTLGSAMNKLTRALHTEFRQVELDLEHFFGGAREIVSLGDACIRLSQVGSIFTLLDLPQAYLATNHLRVQINALLMQRPSQASPIRETPVSWATNLGNLCVLADVLAYQLELAKKAFHFDAAVGSLVFQRLPDPFAPDPTGTRSRSMVSAPGHEATEAMAPTATPEAGSIAVAAPAQTLPDDTFDDELRPLFLAEAHTVIAQARQAIVQTTSTIGEHAQQQDLYAIRRAFHTLKGGARMVGLQEFGDAAWAFEQLLNEHLVQARNPLADVLAASDDALAGLQEWVGALNHGVATPHSETQFRHSADALRLHSARRALRADHHAAPAPMVPGTPEALDPAPESDTLRLSEPLRQVFTAEASERIGLMRHELSQWNVVADAGHQQALRDLAHALQGGAATVGCRGLAALARALESCLESLGPGTPLTADRQQLLQDCLVELENLLQRFTQGHLDKPQVSLIAALQRFDATTPDAAQGNGNLSIPKIQPQRPAPQHEDTELDTLDAEIWPVFQDEAHELLQTLGMALRGWTLQPDSTTAAGQVRRLLHTLKGSARLAGAMHIGALAHDLESYLSDIPDGKATPLDMSMAREALDAIQVHFHQLQPVAELTVPTIEEAPAVDLTLRQVQATLRVRAGVVDTLLDQSSEVLLIRSRMQSRVTDMLAAMEVIAHNAARLREQLRELEMQSELQMQSRSSTQQSDSSGLDPLELDRFTRLQEITRMMAESHDDLGTMQKVLRAGLTGLDRDLALQSRQARDMHHHVLAMRLVAFDDIAARLYAVVRQAAKDVGISVRLEVSGSTTQLERSLLHRIAPCLEHILRNAVVHGIEPAAMRIASGKPPTGLIRISVEQTGQETRIDVRDDGAGLNTDRVRAKAIEKSMLPQDGELGDAAALALLLQPGFSTSDDITLVAGRGVGMDVVQSDVQALGGYLSIQSEAGQGMCFSMILPLAVALTQITLFRVGKTLFGVPSNMVARLAELPSAAGPDPGEGRSFLDLADHGRVELFWAGDLLEGPDPASEQAKDSLHTVVFSSTGRAVALQVDQAMGEREMTLRNLGPQLSDVPALIGAGVLDSGELLLIYNPVALASVHGAAARIRQAARAARSYADSSGSEDRDMRDGPVLVVDDSITMRRVTERLILREGLRVVLAGNGIEALEKLKTIHPAVILSDIEMPRLDGFDLVRRIRADARTADIPIVIISSRVAQKHRDIAAQLGANHYLGKPFKEAELLAVLRLYCGEKSPA